MSSSTTLAAPGLRERKKRETHQALRAAATRLALAEGPDAVTVERIAEEAGVSARTFFNYFPSKEEALAGYDPQLAEHCVATAAGRPAAELPWLALRHALVALAMEITSSKEEWRQRIALIQRHPQILAASLRDWASMESALVRVIADRTGIDPATDLYPATLVAAATAAARVAVTAWGHSDDSVPPAVLVAAALDQLGSGLAGPD